MGNEECIIIMSAGRKVKKCVTTQEMLSETTETVCRMNLS
jgi:hypothetical protein